MRCLSFALAAVTLTAAPVLSGALEEHVLFEGLAVGEGWTTDDDSVLLSTNEGDPAGAADLQFWQAIEFHPSFHLFAMEELSAESGSGEGTQSELTLMLLRYSRRGDHPFSIDAGKITTPIGSFPDRHLADVNPLIGRPANYDLEYPLGVAFNGRVSRFDYMASVVSLPLRDGRAMPEADDAPRPALAFGVTPFTGFRMGAFGTRGPFLGVESEEMMAAGSSWREFDQQVIGLDFSFTRGYFVLNGEISTASYEVPSHASKIHGKSWFLEGRQTITPRLFVALRLEQSEYPFILPISPAYWVARPVNLYDAEAGLGFRISPTTLLKGSYRRDLWPVDESIRQYYPEGYAVALQLSQRFDVVSWFSRRP
jgi:hypothetical protein